MIRDVSLQRTAFENEGGDETSSLSPSPSLMQQVESSDGAVISRADQRRFRALCR